MIGFVYCAITAEGHFEKPTINPTFLYQHFKRTGFHVVRVGYAMQRLKA